MSKLSNRRCVNASMSASIARQHVPGLANYEAQPQQVVLSEII